MIIYIDRAMLNAFRKKCRENYPVESFAVLDGIRGEGGVYVTAIKPIAHVATPDKVEVKNEAMIRSKIHALRKGAEFIGTIHSHCSTDTEQTCWHLSTTDIKSALKDGESVCGVVYVYDGGHRTEVHWYVPSPLPKVIFKGEEK
jgi:proteasome lid subunit RPN8/RPN11